MRKKKDKKRHLHRQKKMPAWPPAQNSIDTLSHPRTVYHTILKNARRTSLLEHYKYIKVKTKLRQGGYTHGIQKDGLQI